MCASIPSISRRSLSHWGAFTAEVENGVVTGVKPFEHDPAPVDLINCWPEMLYSENRVLRPAVRKGWLRAAERGFAERRGVRGEDTFLAVPWDEALELVTREIARVLREHGNSAIFGGSYGWSSAGRLHHARTLVHRFMAAIGGCTGQTTNYSFGAAMTLLPHILGDAQAVSGPITDWNAILENCDLFLAFGGIAEKNWKVQSGGSGAHTFSRWMQMAAQSHTSFVNISPIRTDVDDALNASWIGIRPGTDAALILALAHTVETEGGTDRDFLDAYCVGADRFIDYVTGRLDGVPKSPEWAASITTVAAETIRSLGRRLIGRRSMLTAAWSLQRAEHGEQPYWALVALAAMLGQIGLPGCGVGFGYGSICGMGNPKYDLPVANMPVPEKAASLKIPVARVADMLLNPGATFDYNGKSFIYPEIRLVYWAGGNPFHHHQELFRLKEAFQRPDTVIVHESWWTATAKHADIVLPATTTLERNDIGGSSRDAYLLAMEKAIEPVGESRDDFRIFSDLSDRLGAGGAFHEHRSEGEWLRYLYEQFCSEMARRGFNPPNFETFWEQGYVRIPEPGDSFTLLKQFRDDPVGARLPTPSGKIELYSETIASFAYPDCPGHPVWMEPSEWLGGGLSARYPLHLLSHQPADKLHGQMDASTLSRAAKIDGRSVLLMNLDDAEVRGLKDGDCVRAFNDRGACLATVMTTRDLVRGVVRLPTGATFDPLIGTTDRLDLHGNPNVLTPDIGTSRLGQGCSAQTCLVEVERYDGSPRPIQAFSAPPIENRS